MNTYDHYAETQKLTDMLRKEGLSDYSDALLNAMNDGATGTEIFLALRWNVKKLIDNENCSDVSEMKAKRLLKELNSALQ